MTTPKLDSVLSGPALYKGTKIPSPVPSWLQVDEARREDGNVIQVNEKSVEQKSWWKAINYPSRIDYLASFQNEMVFVLAIEKLLAIEVPAKATWVRMALSELNRIHSHLIWLGTMGLELGVQSMYMYCFEQRENVLDLFEMVTGVRVHGRYCQAGGLAEDIPPAFVDEARAYCRNFRKLIGEYERLTWQNKMWQRRTRGIGIVSAEDAIRLGLSGPNLRGSGLNWDIRKREPYLFYDQVDFDVPVYESGDCDARARVRIDEMRESLRIVEQSLDKVEQLAGEPWIADDRKVVLPPREELQTSMESLIHHFKLVSEGYRVPAGEVYVAIEGPRGEQGCYVVSDGGPKPWRVHFRAPSFLAIAAAPALCQEHLIADLIAISASLDTLMGDSDR
jgi:NADH-quinone oxidoreductase subunit D